MVGEYYLIKAILNSAERKLLLQTDEGSGEQSEYRYDGAGSAKMSYPSIYSYFTPREGPG
jgi:hypothetical protein